MALELLQIMPAPQIVGTHKVGSLFEMTIRDAIKSVVANMEMQKMLLHS